MLKIDAFLKEKECIFSLERNETKCFFELDTE